MQLPDNEPELDQKYGCALPAAWLDHLRIRPAGLRAAFEDMNADTGAGLALTVLAAPFVVASQYSGSLAQLSVQVRVRVQGSGLPARRVTRRISFLS